MFFIIQNLKYVIKISISLVTNFFDFKYFVTEILHINDHDKIFCNIVLIFIFERANFHFKSLKANL